MNTYTNQRASKGGLNLDGSPFFRSIASGGGGRAAAGGGGYDVGGVLFSVGLDEGPAAFFFGRRRVWSFETEKAAKPFGSLTHLV